MSPSPTEKGVRVTTKRGDSGTTDLFGGARVSKSSEVIRAVGSCDSLQATLGLTKVHLTDAVHRSVITLLQQHLYECMSELAQAKTVTKEDIQTWITELEMEQKKLQDQLKIAHKFIIPGENLPEAWCQFTRTAVRSFERDLCTYIDNDSNNQELAKYIPFVNRMSDFFFVLGQVYATPQP